VVLLIVPASCLIGIETSAIVTVQSTFDCLKKQGFQFSNIRAFSLEGIDLDLSIKDTLIYSQRAGLRTELFVRPCRSKFAKAQIDIIILAIAEQYYERLWIYLEHNPNKGCEWGTDYKANCDYVKEMLSQVKYFDQKSGIYTSAAFYKKIFGSYQCDLGDLPLIYEQPNGSPSFEGYEKIGNWETPYGKMFQSNQSACGITINKIYEKSDSNLAVE
jgi:hypothetical protein